MSTRSQHATRPAPTRKGVPAPVPRIRPWSLWLASAVLLFLAIDALPVGVMLMAQPHGDPAGMPSAWIDATFFGAIGGWLIPGIVLTTVIGFGSVFMVYALQMLPDWAWMQRINPAKSAHWSWPLLILLGSAIMVWIVVQVILMPYSFLQPVVFALGLALVLLAMTPGLRHWTAAP